MIVYSITYSVDQPLVNDWMGWMHLAFIPRLMDSGYFQSFQFRRLIDPPPQQGTRTYNVQFTCESLQQLAAYKNTLEPEHLKLFEGRYKDKVVFFQSVLEQIEL